MSIGQAPNAGESQELIEGRYVRGISSGNNALFGTVTAHAGGLQAAATSLNPDAGMYVIGVCASDHDSVKLPFAQPGQWKMIFNSTTHICDFYGQAAANKSNGLVDTINGTAGSTAYSLAGGKSAIIFCGKTGAWSALLSA